MTDRKQIPASPKCSVCGQASYFQDDPLLELSTGYYHEDCIGKTSDEVEESEIG